MAPTLVLETEALATEISVANEELKVDLADGRRIIVPLAWYPRLLHASPSERRNWQLLGGGYAIEWPGLDEHIGVEGFVSRSSRRRESAVIQSLVGGASCTLAAEEDREAPDKAS